MKYRVFDMKVERNQFGVTVNVFNLKTRKRIDYKTFSKYWWSNVETLYKKAHKWGEQQIYLAMKYELNYNYINVEEKDGSNIPLEDAT